ncbi:Predicted cation transporter [Phaffia rhodozyma]|uniref:glutathione-specific gamma-glutamylcyclotransferase n=1 Tax=Phaffia rhodozyma TaxID=264483 RepID=A0A0F7STG5_PHARH|nr:Predicted cation transporter [Phaffia rhodozyma]
MTLVFFGYGSLVWKPPPHTVGKKQGYVKGFIRRFAQSSNDHRGVPDRPGRVVTLVSAQDWEGITGERTSEEDAKVWGVGWEIDGSMESKVKADLDHREKNGYTVEQVAIYDLVDGVETVIVPDATIYVGKVDNEAFVGSEPLDFLAKRILSCQGPSGPNREYLYRLAGAVRGLVGDCQDAYLFELEETVRRLEKGETAQGAGSDR